MDRSIHQETLTDIIFTFILVIYFHGACTCICLLQVYVCLNPIATEELCGSLEADYLSGAVTEMDVTKLPVLYHKSV